MNCYDQFNEIEMQPIKKKIKQVLRSFNFFC